MKKKNKSRKGTKSWTQNEDCSQRPNQAWKVAFILLSQLGKGVIPHRHRNFLSRQGFSSTLFLSWLKSWFSYGPQGSWFLS